MPTTTDFAALSSEFLTDIYKKQPVDNHLKTIAEAPAGELLAALNTDAKRKTFWINLYNGMIVYLLRDNPELYDDRGAFFKAKQLRVAQHDLSFDDIEHGILRRGTNKLSLGYLPKLFRANFNKNFQVDSLDFRIHFALNCGAASCPPVKIYEANQVDRQMENSAQSFLQKTSTYKADEETVYVTALLNWFRGDFGDRKALLKKHDVIPDDADPSFEYDTYDWTMDLDNWLIK